VGVQKPKKAVKLSPPLYYKERGAGRTPDGVAIEMGRSMGGSRLRPLQAARRETQIYIKEAQLGREACSDVRTGNGL